jgi:hypothetical protein
MPLECIVFTPSSMSHAILQSTLKCNFNVITITNSYHKFTSKSHKIDFLLISHCSTKKSFPKFYFEHSFFHSIQKINYNFLFESLSNILCCFILKKLKCQHNNGFRRFVGKATIKMKF